MSSLSLARGVSKSIPSRNGMRSRTRPRSFYCVVYVSVAILAQVTRGRPVQLTGGRAGGGLSACGSLLLFKR
eukprot:4931231-Amphidinium_carterae.1